MKSLISLLLLWGTLLFSTALPAQQKDIVPLQPGDTLPLTIQSHILSHIAQKGSGNSPELILVPFWSSTCGTSKRLLPRLLELEGELGGRLAVLPATREAPGPIDSFWRQHPGLRQYTTPQLRGDTLLRHYFPYALVPHVVWLHPSGRVVAITAGDLATRDYITAMLQGNAPPLPQKEDVLDFDPNAPLLASNPSLRYHSIIQAYQPGLPGQLGYQWDSSRQNARAYAINMSLSLLYSLAFIGAGELPPNRWRWQLNNTGRLQFRGAPHEAPVWKAQNLFSYELNLPGLPPNRLATLVQQDLDRFFGFYSRLEQRRVTCWVLTRRKGAGTSKATLPNEGGSEKGAGHLQAHFQLVRHLNSRPGTAPVIDETGLKQPLYLDLPASGEDFRTLKRVLRRQGLHLKKERRRIPFILITEKEDGHSASNN